ncbi:MAG: hypothetical protein ACLP2X_08730 [Syntrophobacteraceae bacterium]|jgi:hypothetical protein
MFDTLYGLTLWAWEEVINQVNSAIRTATDQKHREGAGRDPDHPKTGLEQVRAKTLTLTGSAQFGCRHNSCGYGFRTGLSSG